MSAKADTAKKPLRQPTPAAEDEEEIETLASLLRIDVHGTITVSDTAATEEEESFELDLQTTMSPDELMNIESKKFTLTEL